MLRRRLGFVNGIRETDSLALPQRVTEPRQFVRLQEPLALMLGETFDGLRGIIGEGDLVAPGGPIPDSRNDGDGFVCRIWLAIEFRMKARHIQAPHINDALGAQNRQDMKLQRPPIGVASAALALNLDMLAQPFLGHLAECPHLPRGLALGDRVGALLNIAENLFRFRARFISRQSPMIADRYPARAPIQPELRDIDFLSARKGGDPKARERSIPENLAVLTGRAGKPVNRPLRDGDAIFLGHLATLSLPAR